MNVYSDFPLSEVLWYRIGGSAKYLLEVQSKEDIFEALDFIQKHNIKNFHVVGIGANLLFPDTYFDGAVIQLVRREDSGYIHLTEEGRVVAFAGELLDDVIHFSFNNGLIGLEWAGGLPGTVGGAVRGNVGAFGGEIKDSIASVEILEVVDANGILSNDVKVLPNAALDFSYRSSLIKRKKNSIILSAQFQLKKAELPQVAEAKDAYRKYCEYRQANHPLEYPSCGSTFKNIVDKEQVQKVLNVFPDLQTQVQQKWHGKVSMGHLLEKLGFAGYQIGNAQASLKHPNFIINTGGATAADVIAVISVIENKFSKTFNFEPEVEIEIIPKN